MWWKYSQRYSISALILWNPVNFRRFFEVARIEKLAHEFQQTLFLDDLLHPVPVWHISTRALKKATLTAPAFLKLHAASADWCGRRESHWRYDGGERYNSHSRAGKVNLFTPGISDSDSGERATAAPAHTNASAAEGQMLSMREQGFPVLSSCWSQGNKTLSSFNTCPSSMVCEAVGG